MSAPLRSPAQGATPATDTGIRGDVLRGLLSVPKTLPPKLFYDETGARLFERICTLDEYYLTRAELDILRRRADEIASLAGPNCALVEYGSGAGVKVRLLLDALERPAAYVPIDISPEQLAHVASELAAAYPGIPVHATYADYTQPVRLTSLPAGARRLAFFPGSTIGNFHPAEAAAFLRRVRWTVGSDGALVMGVDRRKDPRMLHAAYNDAAGVTAAFNLNLLTRINRELGADFDLARFRHRAVFNNAASRIEMHIVSGERHVVHVGDETIAFARGETIWTECSYKYDRQRLEALVSAAGFEIGRLWTDASGRFWVAFLTPAARSASVQQVTE
jgi:dimethylhistidine N-methyltransferase